VGKDGKPRSSFATGFGVAFGCLIAIAVFVGGSFLLTIGSCVGLFTAAAVSHQTAHTTTPPPTDTSPPVVEASTKVDLPQSPKSDAATAPPAAPSGNAVFEVVSELSPKKTSHLETVFVENGTKAEIATHVLGTVADGRWEEIFYFDNRAKTPHLVKGSVDLIPDSAWPYLVATYNYNPSNSSERLLFRKGFPAGETPSGQAARLVKSSLTLANWDDNEPDTPKPQKEKSSKSLDPIEEWRSQPDPVTTPKTDKPPEKVEDFRTWASADGRFSTEATIVSVANGTVTLKKRDGKTSKVPQEKLSEADQEFVKKWIRDRR